MNIFTHFCLVLLCCATLAACAARPSAPLTFEEQQARAAKVQCAASASGMTDGVQNSSNMYWRSYFEMCMNSLGVSEAEMKKLWY